MKSFFIKLVMPMVLALGMVFAITPAAQAYPTHTEVHCKHHSFALGFRHVTECITVYYRRQSDGTGHVITYAGWSATANQVSKPAFTNVQLKGRNGNGGFVYWKGKTWPKVSPSTYQQSTHIVASNSQNEMLWKFYNRVHLRGWADWKPTFYFHLCSDGSC